MIVPQTMKLGDLFNIKKPITIEKWPISINCREQLIETFSTRLVYSPILVEMLNTKPDVLYVDEDVTMFKYLLDYMRYPDYNPHNEIVDEFEIMREKYQIKKKFKTQYQLNDYCTRLVESNNGDLSKSFYEACDSQDYRAIGSFGIDINYDVSLVDLMRRKRVCPYFFKYIYRKGRRDLLEQIQSIFHLACTDHNTRMIDSLCEDFESHIKIDLAVKYCIIEKCMLSMYHLLIYCTTQECIDGLIDIYPEILIICKESNDSSYLAILHDHLTGKSPQRWKLKLEVHEPLPTITFRCKDKMCSTTIKDLAFVPELGKIVNRQEIVDEDADFIKVLLRYVAYPDYILPNVYSNSEQMDLIFEKYNVVKRGNNNDWRERLTLRANSLINAREGDLAKAFEDSFCYDGETILSIYNSGLDIDNVDTAKLYQLHRKNPMFLGLLIKAGHESTLRNINSIFNGICSNGTFCQLHLILTNFYGQLDIEKGCLRAFKSGNRGTFFPLANLIDFVVKDEDINSSFVRQCDHTFLCGLVFYKYIIINKTILIKFMINAFFTTFGTALEYYFNMDGVPFKIEKELVDNIIKGTHDRISKLQYLATRGFEVENLDQIIVDNKNGLLPKYSASRSCTMETLEHLNGEVLD